MFTEHCQERTDSSSIQLMYNSCMMSDEVPHLKAVKECRARLERFQRLYLSASTESSQTVFFVHHTAHIFINRKCISTDRSLLDVEGGLKNCL